mgnify:CR=1 FL=1
MLKLLDILLISAIFKVVFMFFRGVVCYDKEVGMKSSDITAEMVTIKEKLDVLSTELDALVEQFQTELHSMALSWVQHEVERSIESHPEIVEGLGDEKLKTLKEKVHFLKSSLPELVKKEVSDKSLWPHHQVPPTMGTGRDKDEYFFLKSFRAVISHLGAVLDEFGLLSETPGHLKSWDKIGPGKFRYINDQGIGSLASQSVNEFIGVFNEYCDLWRKSEAKEKEYKKVHAREKYASV